MEAWADPLDQAAQRPSSIQDIITLSTFSRLIVVAEDLVDDWEYSHEETAANMLFMQHKKSIPLLFDQPAILNL